MRRNILSTLLFILLFKASTLAQSSGVFIDFNEALKHPDNVKILDLSYQELTSVPDTFEVFSKLEEIRLVNNNLSELPRSFSTLAKLKRLDLTGNLNLDFQQVFMILSGLEHLEFLNLSKCEMMFLPAAVSRCDSLKVLNLNSNQLFFLPSAIGNIQQLEELNLSDNFLYELPESFPKLKSLRIIHLENNPHLNTERAFHQLSMNNVRDVFFSNQEIWGDLALLSSASQLSFEECSFYDRPEFSSLRIEKMTLVGCTGLNADSVLIEVARMDSLRQFSFEDNSITSIDLRPLSTSPIQTLRLRFQNISDWNRTLLPLSRMPNLIELDLSGNGIVDLPNNLNHLQSLAILDLSQNELNHSVLRLRRSLKSLNLYSNNIIETDINTLIRNYVDCDIKHDFMFQRTSARYLPHPQLKQQPEWFKWDGEQPKRILLNSGTSLSIPEEAFVTKEGEPVSGPIDMMVEEFLSVAQIFASGIPMTYDSAGVTYNFRSGGMMEVRAFQNDQELMLQPGKTIEATMATNAEGNFNVYNLNDSTGQWEKEAGVALATTGLRRSRTLVPLDSLSWYNANNTWYLPSKEVMLFRIRRYPKLNSFVIQVNNRKGHNRYHADKIYSEAKYLSTKELIYEGQYVERDYEILENILDSVRDRYRHNRRDNSYPISKRDIREGPELISDFYLKSNPEADNFILTIVYRGEILEFPVAIHSTRSNPKVVQKEYRKFYSRYAASFKERSRNWEVADSSFEAFRLENLNIRWSALRAEAIDSGGRLYLPVSALRFSIGGLGVINCDVPLPIIPENPQLLVRASYRSQEDKVIKNKRMTYVLDYTNNAAYRYQKGSPASLYKNSFSMIVVQLDNGKMGLVRYDQIKDVLDKHVKRPEFILEEYKDMTVLMDTLNENLGSLN